MKPIRLLALTLVALLPALTTCADAPVPAPATVPATGPTTRERDVNNFEAIVEMVHESDASRGRAAENVLASEGKSRVLVCPQLQGRLLTMRVGAVESTGLVNADAIAAGDKDAHFNNYGGFDRCWLGPEAGQFGLYFEPGAELTRALWRTPAAFNAGPFPVVSRDGGKVVMKRDMEVKNYAGTTFKCTLQREVGALKAGGLEKELGLQLPAGVGYAGAYSDNTLTNAGPEAWSKDKGLVSLWVLGQFNASDACVIIAPFKAGDEAQLGPVFNDDYFGKVSQQTPERLKVIGNAVLFRADARREGKLGMSPSRTTGRIGSMDFGKNLLTVIQFSVPDKPEMYGNSHWEKRQAEPFKGDALQTYNSGNADRPGERAKVAFYEMESASPVRELGPGQGLNHRVATHQFQGGYAPLSAIAKQTLGVDLDEVHSAMLKGGTEGEGKK